MENLRQYLTGQMQRVMREEEPARSELGAATFALRACSACAGDYEDPERTAWTAGPEEAEPVGEDEFATAAQEADQRNERATENESDSGEGFPAQ